MGLGPSRLLDAVLEQLLIELELRLKRGYLLLAAGELAVKETTLLLKTCVPEGGGGGKERERGKEEGERGGREGRREEGKREGEQGKSHSWRTICKRWY